MFLTGALQRVADAHTRHNSATRRRRDTQRALSRSAQVLRTLPFVTNEQVWILPSFLLVYTSHDCAASFYRRPPPWGFSTRNGGDRTRDAADRAAAARRERPPQALPPPLFAAAASFRRHRRAAAAPARSGRLAAAAAARKNYRRPVAAKKGRGRAAAAGGGRRGIDGNADDRIVRRCPGGRQSLAAANPTAPLLYATWRERWCQHWAHQQVRGRGGSGEAGGAARMICSMQR